MDNVNRYSSFIKRIVTAPHHIRKKLLQTSNLNIIKAICEVFLNIAKGNITVSNQVLLQLRKHRAILQRLLTTAQGGFAGRKTILVNNSQILIPLASVFKK